MWLKLVMMVGVALTTGQDNRCFLSGGGSTESFFVPESESVGSVLGQLRVIGRECQHASMHGHYECLCRRCRERYCDQA